MLRKRIVFFGTLAAFGGILSAGGCSSGPAEGTQGGPCFPNGTCNSGLACVAMTCQASEAGMMDSGPMDAGKDTNKPDTQPMDSGPMCPTPGDVTNFTPTYVPAKSMQVCSPTQVQAYVTNCWMMGGNCSMYKMSNMACSQCMESLRKDPMQQSDAKFGPVYIGNGLGFLNFSGCEELSGDLNCAKATQALAFCTYEACDNICSIPPETSANYNKCTTAATSTKCKMYKDAETMACGTDSGAAAYSFCHSGFTTFQDGLVKYGNLFCGTGPGDAGSDG